MTVRIVSGTAGAELAGAIAAALGIDPAERRLERFPDGELRPRVAHLRGADTYVVQSTGPPVNENIMELILLLDACHRAGAGRVTVVVPYFGYARQDRRGVAGEAVGARVVAETLLAAGAQRLVTVDPHTAALESMCGMPVEMVSAVPTLADALAPSVTEGTVIVAPDLGAVKLAEHYASLLRCPVAMVRKTRVTGATVHAEELMGGVEGRSAIVIDDMVSTGGTVEAAVRVLLAHGVEPEPVVAATHGPLVAGRTPLGDLPLRCLLATDTVESARTSALPVQVRSVAPLLADTIDRLHRNEPLDDLLIRT